MKQLLQYEEFKNMTLEIENVIGTLNYNLHTIRMNDVFNKMGFPENWSELANIEKEIEENE